MFPMPVTSGNVGKLPAQLYRVGESGVVSNEPMEVEAQLDVGVECGRPVLERVLSRAKRRCRSAAIAACTPAGFLVIPDR
jgi:hypothetical protein